MKARRALTAITVAAVKLLCPGGAVSQTSWPLPYDYKAHPVRATDVDSIQGVPMVVDGVGGGSVLPIAPYTYLNKPGLSHRERKGHLDWGGAGWTDTWSNDCSEPESPTPERPARLRLEYPAAVAVARFALYFPRQGNMDGYLPITAHAAAPRTLQIFRSEDGRSWEPAVYVDPLPWTCPQVVEIPEPRPARHYLFSFEAMYPGNTALRLYEIETYLDATVPLPTEPLTPALPHEEDPPLRVPPRQRSLAGEHWAASLDDAPSGWRVQLKCEGKSLETEIALLPDADAQQKSWSPVAGDVPAIATPVAGGWARAWCTADASGLRVHVKMPPPRPGERRRFVLVRARAPGAVTRVIPSLHWALDGRKSAWPGWWLPTCMAAIETAEGSTLVLAPEKDWCRIGVDGEDLTLCLFPDGGEASALLTLVPGDWWAAYRLVVQEVDHFRPRRQSWPAIEAAAGTLQWLQADSNWSSHWGGLRSFPARVGQPAEENFFFIFYGAPYTLPALWQQYVLSGDNGARLKAESHARFLLECPARIRSGTLRGAYFSQFGGSRTANHSSDQAGNSWVISHTTGAVLWSLLYHRDRLESAPPELDAAILESAELLRRLQDPSGGWCYAYTPATGECVRSDFASAGTIWNIWALHRTGKTFNSTADLEAAARGKAWWADQFLKVHTYTGYWEDSNTGGVIYPTREGYECSMATLAFLEMGDQSLALAAARDLATWVHTRTPGYRTYDTGYGNMNEQLTWPANVYLVPQAAFAFGRVLEATGDDFWEPYASIARGLGWWVERDSGAAFFPNEASGFIPIHNVPLYKNYWVDWNGAQQASRTIWWLMDAFRRNSGELVKIDPFSLSGTIGAEEVKTWLPEDLVSIKTQGDLQLNWMGFRSTRGALYLAVLNDLEEKAAEAEITFSSSLGVEVSSPVATEVSRSGRREIRLPAAGARVQLEASARSVTLLSLRKL